MAISDEHADMPVAQRTLVAIPVHDEAEHVDRVLEAVRPFGIDILVVDDGSTDDTPRLVARQPVHCIRHPVNQGYGQSLRDAFAFAAAHRYDWVITMDCDEQHEPRFIPAFLRAIERNDADIVSGSRYLRTEGDDAPADRRRINRTITAELNEALGWSLTDSFCGFKAHRTAAMSRLRLDVTGYDFPLQFWVQAAALGLRVREIPVSRVYVDLNRTFGNGLDDPSHRLATYRATLARELARMDELRRLDALARLDQPARRPAALRLA
jgi:glycosyltransferase involved in cell wall biosynthesis